MAKWADDLIQWSTSEYNFIDFPDRYCNTSSIMMQKKNVIGPAEVKGASAEALGCFVTSYHALKGTTGLPITERYYARRCKGASPTMRRARPRLALRSLACCCVIHKDHMAEQAWRHWATATDLAAALVRQRDLPWRTAHQIVGILIRLCEERELGPADVTPALLDEAAHCCIPRAASRPDLEREQAFALDPRRFIAGERTLRGGPAPAESLRQARLFEAGIPLWSTMQAVADINARLEAAAAKARSGGRCGHRRESRMMVVPPWRTGDDIRSNGGIPEREPATCGAYACISQRAITRAGNFSRPPGTVASSTLRRWRSRRHPRTF